MLIVVSLPFAAKESSGLIPGGVAAAGSESAQVESILRDHFPRLTAENTYMLLAPRQRATGGELSAEIWRVARAVHHLHRVTLTSHDREVALFAAELVSPMLLPLHVRGTRSAVERIDEELVDVLKANRRASGHIGVYLIGEGALWTGLQKTVKSDLTNAEVVGFPILLVILLLILGSFAAALLPVALGLGTVIVTGLAVYWLSRLMQLSIFVTDTASLIGIGVAVDYSLIQLSRVRQELASGRSLADAQGRALATSGRAILFSGATVILSLSGLYLIPDVTLRSMTVGATLAVAIAVAMAVTMLPALVSAMGDRRVVSRRLHEIPRGWRHRARSGRRLTWRTWTAAVTRRPILVSLGVAALLLLLASPALDMKMSTGALRQLSDHDETRVGFEKTARITGPGALGPTYVVAGGRNYAVDLAALERLRAPVTRLQNVKGVGRIERSQTGRYATFAVVPTVDPESPRAKLLVRRVRALAVGIGRASHVSVTVGGTTAIQVDQEDAFSRNIWKAILAILLASLVVLTVLLRSVVLPVKAVLMNLLAVGAAYGVLVAIFQWSWGAALLGVHSLGHLETLTPPLVLAIVFGLSMDYEIFLLSRIREEWEGASPAQAVARGLAASASTITNAAVLLVSVFAIFVATGVVSVKEIGVGGAVAIGLDATLIRLLLVPALMTVFGSWNWWWPRPFATLLPVALTAQHLPTHGEQPEPGTAL